MHIPFYKKLLSYLLPITLESTIGKSMTVLTLQLYRNQFMLITPRAIYSYGTRYNPFKKSFAAIKDRLPEFNRFLLLGTGLGSALNILQQTYHCFPSSTLVDYDEDIIAYSIKYMNLNSKQNVVWKCDDAFKFLQSSDEKFDLIGVDIFRDLVQPEFSLSSEFFQLCSTHLSAGGICIFNMILGDDNRIVELEKKLMPHFAKVNFILDRMNTYFICHA